MYEYSSTEILVSIVITWGIGLTPPLLLRYFFVKRYVSKPSAFSITFILYILNLFIFISLGSQSKTHGALALVAIASYYILRSGSSPNSNRSVIEEDITFRNNITERLSKELGRPATNEEIDEKVKRGGW